MQLTPYLSQQLVLAALGAGLALALDAALGRVAALRTRPLARLFLGYGALSALLVVWIAAVRALDHSHSTFQFIAVALGYYGGAFALPASALARAWREPDPRRRWPSGAVAALAIAVGLDALVLEPDRLVTVEHELAFASWPPDAPPLRVVHVSDLQTVGECEREREAARRINALAPDLIVITGDYAAGPFSDPEPAVAAARAFLAALERPRLGIVCVPGHAEPERLRERIFAGMGVEYLANCELELAVDERDGASGRRLRLYGARTLHQGFDVSGWRPAREAGVLNVLVSHEPDASWEVLDRPVDLHLCGHTHGGQIALPFVGPPMTLSQLPKRFARGLHRFGPHWIHVSPGIGMEGNFAPRIRLMCPPEIDLLVLRGGGAELAPCEPPARS